MRKITRRSALSGLAVTPFLSGPFSDLKSVFPQVRHTSGTRWLYVYIHGASVVEIQQGGVRLLPPAVWASDTMLAHEYRAGYLPNGEGSPLGQHSPLSLTGFLGAGVIPQIDKTTCPCLYNLPLNTTNLYYSVVLPLPNAVVPLRQISRDATTKPFFNLAELKDLQWLPLLLLLQYELQPDDYPILVGTNWKDDGRNPLILHLRAEPGDPALGKHDALAEVGAILNKKPFQLDACYASAVACSKNNEEQSLLEIRNPSSACAPIPPCTKDKLYVFSRPANCVSIVVNNAGG
jgi:hypothetical protein